MTGDEAPQTASGGSSCAPDVEVVPSDELPASTAAACRELLDAAFGDGLDDSDWEHALGGWHVLVHEAGVLVAHAAVVPRDLDVDRHRFQAGYVEAVATRPHRQGHGFGSAAMVRLDAVLRERFEFGALSTGAPAFYERLGWERWRGPTFVRDGDLLRRTADEDDGILVRRFGASAAVRLDARLSCEDRPGDAW